MRSHQKYHLACAVHIKRMIQQDKGIGKVAKAVPAMLCVSLELFSNMLVKQVRKVIREMGANTMTKRHVLVAIKQDSRLNFLLHLVEGMGGDKREKKKEKIDSLFQVGCNNNMEQMKPQAECPVCLSIPLSKIFINVNGHNICKLCYDQLLPGLAKKCPLSCPCDNHPPINIEDMDLDCNNPGCGIKLSREESEKHCIGCPQREVPCPIIFCAERIMSRLLKTHIFARHNLLES